MSASIAPSSLTDPPPRQTTMPALPKAPSVRYGFHDVQGTRLFYRSAGNPSAPAFVLLHGFPSSSHMFRHLIPELARHFYVIAPDYPGFGHSDAPSPAYFSYTFDTLADHVASLLANLGIHRYHLYLQDYGGPVGLRLATAQPERVLGLVIQNANAYVEGISPMVRDVFLPLWDRGDEGPARHLLDASTTRFQYQTGASHLLAISPDAWVFDQALLDRPGNAEIQLALFRDYRHNLDLYAKWHRYFRQYQPHTLVLWGRGDPLFLVEGADAYRRDLPHAVIHFLDGGHFALEEHADTAAERICQQFAPTSTHP